MFADLHIHMLLSGSDWKAAIAGHQPHPDDILIKERLSDYQSAGISYLRDGGDRFGVCLRAKELAPEYGITYRTPAFPIYKKSHYGSFIGRGWSDFAEYRALLAEAQASGADFIKLMVSGLMDFSAYGVLTEEPLTGAEMHDLIAAAHDLGFAVMAHCNGAKAVKNAVTAEVDSIEHGAVSGRRSLPYSGRKRYRLGTDSLHHRQPDRQWAVSGRCSGTYPPVGPGEYPKSR